MLLVLDQNFIYAPGAPLFLCWIILGFVYAEQLVLLQRPRRVLQYNVVGFVPVDGNGHAAFHGIIEDVLQRAEGNHDFPNDLRIGTDQRAVGIYAGRCRAKNRREFPGQGKGAACGNRKQDAAFQERLGKPGGKIRQLLVFSEQGAIHIADNQFDPHTVFLRLRIFRLIPFYHGTSECSISVFWIGYSQPNENHLI